MTARPQPRPATSSRRDLLSEVSDSTGGAARPGGREGPNSSDGSCATGARRLFSAVVRTVGGRTGFLGLLAPDGTLLEANQTASAPPERDLQDTLDRPFWDAAWWAWSPTVQQRLRTSVAQVAAGGTLRYPETALVGRTRLITVDLAWAPVLRAGSVTALLCSAVDVGAGPPGLR